MPEALLAVADSYDALAVTVPGYVVYAAGYDVVFSYCLSAMTSTSSRHGGYTLRCSFADTVPYSY